MIVCCAGWIGLTKYTKNKLCIKLVFLYTIHKCMWIEISKPYVIYYVKMYT